MTEREALNWEPIREFWRNNSGVNWDELETAIKEALAQPEQEPVAWLQFRDNEPPVVAPRDLGTPVFLGIRGGLAHDAGEKP